MVVVLVNCAAAVDATATILFSALTAAAKTPSPTPPSTVASIDDNCYRHHQRTPSPLPSNVAAMGQFTIAASVVGKRHCLGARRIRASDSLPARIGEKPGRFGAMAAVLNRGT